jgi:hypothetical protein
MYFFASPQTVRTKYIWTVPSFESSFASTYSAIALRSILQTAGSFFHSWATSRFSARILFHSSFKLYLRSFNFSKNSHDNYSGKWFKYECSEHSRLCVSYGSVSNSTAQLHRSFAGRGGSRQLFESRPKCGTFCCHYNVGWHIGSEWELQGIRKVVTGAAWRAQTPL